jgi:hypothetical protein
MMISPPGDPTRKSPAMPVRTAMQEAPAALADFRKDGKVRRLILDGTDAGGYEIEPGGSRRR